MISKNIETILSGSSWIRRMFEAGSHLKAKYGDENVFDFSLGNPNLKPPEGFKNTLANLAASSGNLDHAYMPNAGYPHVCRSVADFLAAEQGVNIRGKDVIMTCGAAGALNVIFKTLLDPGDEIITPIPCFVEYKFYAENHGGTLKTVKAKPNFCLDIDKIDSAVTKKTKAVLLNSPNNPTGCVYDAKSLNALGELLNFKSKKFNRTIYLVSDEPYRKIVYDGLEVPSIFSCYNESIVANSYSKDISIPGERIGYLAVNPEAEFNERLIEGMTLANRILGFVNAPALMQRVVALIQGVGVDISAYAGKRDLICSGLANCGYEFLKPDGAFYLFPKTPVPDDVEFVQALQKEMILAVPGSGFGGPGHFRIAFCVDDKTIINSMPGFRRAMEKFKT